MKKKGGYHAQARLDGIREEIALEALGLVDNPPQAMRERIFDEIARLARKYAQLVRHLNDGQAPPPALAGA